MTTPKVPEALLAAVRKGHRFLLTSHINPDGDAIGSAIGLSRVLHKLGKGATIWSRDGVPKLYRPLPGSSRVHSGQEPPKGFPDLFDAVIVLECPSPDRTGLADEIRQLKILNMDHHLGNEHYGVVNWVETASPAVGEMVFRLAQALNVDLDPETANALYLTLVTDTGGFRFSNATPAAFEAAAELVTDGASPETVAKWLYESQPESAMRLLGAMLNSLEMHDGGRVATVWLTQEMMKQCGASHGDTEGLIDYPRSIDGVEAIALFREIEDGIKVSLRSRGQVNVEKIARSHGGGGHANAAGFSSQETAEKLTPLTVEALIAAVAAGTADTAEADTEADGEVAEENA